MLQIPLPYTLPLNQPPRRAITLLNALALHDRRRRSDGTARTREGKALPVSSSLLRQGYALNSRQGNTDYLLWLLYTYPPTTLDMTSLAL